jgi:hypothetical protein
MDEDHAFQARLANEIRRLPPGAALDQAMLDYARLQYFELADIAANARRGKMAAAISPIALEVVKRLDILFDVERDITGLTAEQRLRGCGERRLPVLASLETWLRDERARLSRAASGTKPIDHFVKRMDGFARFAEDGRICLTNNAVEHALRGIVLGRRSWLFARIASLPCSRLHQLLPWE